MIDNPYTGAPVETLQPGENVYGYVAGLTESSPMLVSCRWSSDGTDGTGHYRPRPDEARGGTWNGTKAIVIRLDGSGSVEPLTGPDNARYLSNHAAPLPGQAPETNLLDFSHVGAGIRLLDPTVDPRQR